MKTCIRLPSANERILLPKGSGGSEEERHHDEEKLLHVFLLSFFVFLENPLYPERDDHVTASNAGITW